MLKFYGPEGFESKIEEEIRKQASKVGYKASNISFIPQLDELDLVSNGFSLEVGETEGVQFRTKDHNIEVKLNLVIGGRLGSFSEEQVREKLKRYIKPFPKNNLIEKIAIVASGFNQLIIVMTIKLIAFKIFGSILDFFGVGVGYLTGTIIIILVSSCFADFIYLLCKFNYLHHAN